MAQDVGAQIPRSNLHIKHPSQKSKPRHEVDLIAS
ncbi:hypothetical protein G647_03584 [Cladophialophora carrionii CBS 160.54]|uniref:Uncharacterized protein n=1 Tax=Cladophialophora carrionii CBS 160.54 TaxID=1279043 RepID=V9DBJ7_9EURO|nr:uncharacterized protein G647_03584 [Cladophialophora carrionii CBS 160.54]ETI24215.1 hypothetical protein G647_03584 [Cladophialophora carrionii CBS 160.54]